MFRFQNSAGARPLRTLALPSWLLVSIGGALPAADGETKITYDDHVRTVFENKCFSCHNPDKAKGGLDLTTYGATMAGGSSGSIVEPGAPDASRLYRSMAHLEEPEMPPEGGKLPDDQLKVVADWISTGLLENSGSRAKKPKTTNIALAAPSTGKPEGPPPMPEHLPLEPEVVTDRSFAPADIAASPWAPLVALAAPKQVLLYDTDKLRLTGVLPFPEGFPENLAFSRSGGILIAGGGRGGKMGRAVGWDVKTGERVFEIGNEFDSVLAADLSADQSLVALGGPARKVRVFTVADGEQRYEIKKHTDWVTAIGFSPDGVLLASGDRNGNLFVWEAGTGNPFYTLKGHGGAITAVTWRADSNVLASASEDGSVRLWDMNNGNQIKTWTAHGGGALDLSYSIDGHLVSCGRDNHAKVWDGNGNQKAAANGFGEFPVAACLSGDGTKFVVGDWNGAVKVFASADATPLGDLRANPPSVAARIAEAKAALAEKQMTASGAEQTLANASKATADARAALDAAIAALGAAEKAKADRIAARDVAAAKVNESTAARDAAKADADAAAAALAQVGQDIAAASADAGRVKQLETELAAARAALEQKQASLESKSAELAAADAMLGEAQKQLEVAASQVAPATEAKARAEAELATRSAAEAEAKSALDATLAATAEATKSLRFWEAAAINLERRDKGAERPEREAAIEAAAAQLAEVQAAAEAAARAAETSADALAGAEAELAKREAALATIREKLPDLEWELRLAKVVANQRRTAADTIRAEMADAPEALAPKIEAALAEAAANLAAAESHRDKVLDLYQNSVARAEAAIAEARTAVATHKADHDAKLAAKAQTDTALAMAGEAKASAEAALAALEGEVAALEKRYLDTLSQS